MHISKIKSNTIIESNKKGLRLVIECQKDASIETIIRKLFAKTNLQHSISYNQVALLDKTPTELNLKDCIKIYVEHNQDCIIREAKFDIDKLFIITRNDNNIIESIDFNTVLVNAIIIDISKKIQVNLKHLEKGIKDKNLKEVILRLELQ